MTESLVVIDPCDPPGPVDGAVVGVATKPVTPEQAAPLDVTFVPRAAATSREFVGVEDPAAAAERMRAAAEANPQAARVLAHVLRAGLTEVDTALDFESFAYSTLLGGPEFQEWLDERGPRPLPPPSAEPVLLTRDDALLTITLNRPERRNAYGREVRDALVEGLRVAELDPSVERIVLAGAGPSFCSGGDLDEFGTTPDLVTAHFVRTRHGAGRLLHRLAARTEVRVHGTCVGAGIELPAFAGRIVAAAGTTFRLPEVAMGLIPGAGGTVSIPRRIGRWRAYYLALSGMPLDAPTALEWGLIDEIDGGPEPPGRAESPT